MGVSQAVRNPRSFVARTGRMYRALLFDPRTFYDEYAGSAGIGREVLLVGIIGVVGTLGNYFALGEVTTAFQDAGVVISQDTNFILWRMMISPLLGILGLWFALTVALYAVSWLYSEVGKIYTVWKWSAWALVPLLFANVIHAAAVAYVTLDLDVEDALPIQTTLPADRAALMWAEVGGDPIVVGATLVSVVFVLWSGYIAAPAIAKVRDLDTSEAYRVAAVPTLAYVAYVILQVVGSL